ncbi:hypothetical protein [Aliiroseovarius sp.]|uniref:hypothetical protein n=1 Tax=Aliiroseovarius sp. TaxID=1872442 RepID=UPI003BA95846
MSDFIVQNIVPISLAVAMILSALGPYLMGARPMHGALSGAAFLAVTLGLLNFVTSSFLIALFAGSTAAALLGRVLGMTSAQSLTALGGCLLGLALPILVL